MLLPPKWLISHIVLRKRAYHFTSNRLNYRCVIGQQSDRVLVHLVLCQIILNNRTKCWLITSAKSPPSSPPFFRLSPLLAFICNASANFVWQPGKLFMITCTSQTFSVFFFAVYKSSSHIFPVAFLIKKFLVLNYHRIQEHTCVPLNPF